MKEDDEGRLKGDGTRDGIRKERIVLHILPLRDGVTAEAGVERDRETLDGMRVDDASNELAAVGSFKATIFRNGGGQTNTLRS